MLRRYWAGENPGLEILVTEFMLDMPYDHAPTGLSPAIRSQDVGAREASALPLKIRAEEARMPEYRIYFVGPDDHFHGAKTIECADDDGAFACALEQIGDFPAVEVWCGTKALGRVGLPDQGWPC